MMLASLLVKQNHFCCDNPYQSTWHHHSSSANTTRHKHTTHAHEVGDLGACTEMSMKHIALHNSQTLDCPAAFSCTLNTVCAVRGTASLHPAQVLAVVQPCSHASSNAAPKVNATLHKGPRALHSTSQIRPDQLRSNGSDQALISQSRITPHPETSQLLDECNETGQ